MKKLLILLIMLSLVFVAFAQEEEEYVEDDVTYTAIDEESLRTTVSPRGAKEFDLEITGGLPIHWTDALDHPVDDNEDKTVVGSLSLGVSLVFNFNRKVGLTLDTDISFARSLYGDSVVGSDYIGITTANVLLAPVFYLYNGNFLRVPLAVGIHYYFYSDDFWWDNSGVLTTGDWRQRSDHQFGPGGYLGVQFHFNKNIYLLTRTNVNFDIARFHSAKWRQAGANDDLNEFEWVAALSTKPTFGIGLKF
jgi:hypothetical protein